mmetsp:Transcript_27564/g.70232  ORF Transcript_27564/g.70232 Transcript_27564/m.70232 type:complete len:205 (-) Transcript_27564:36-650(-)
MSTHLRSTQPGGKRSHRDRDRLHLHGRVGTIVACRHLGYLDHHVERGLVDCLAEHGVLRLARAEPVEEVVVHGVHEELRAARVGLAGVRHGESTRLIGDLGSVFILDVAAARSGLGRAGDKVLVCAIWRAASACAPALGVLGVRAAELVHEVWDDAVEVQAIVETRVSQVNEIAHRDRHLLEKKLAYDRAQRGVEGDSRIGHGA